MTRIRPTPATDFNELALPELFGRLTRGGLLARLLELARDEDLGTDGHGQARLADKPELVRGTREGGTRGRDVTTASIIEPGRAGTGRIVARGAGVVAGLAVIEPLLEVFGATGFESPLRFEPALADGDACDAGQVLGRLAGELAMLLTVERTVLNLLGRLGGVATLTRRYVQAVAGTLAVICDTRKTTPGLRALEKYAVRCGGGTLHRIGLYDAALYKDNHLAGLRGDELAGAVRAAVARLPRHELAFVEVEVDTLDQLDALLSLPPGTVDIALLDNMSLAQMTEAVAIRDAEAPGLRLEASGGVTLETVRPIAQTGVDRISVGALTHSAAALDVSLEVLG